MPGAAGEPQTKGSGHPHKSNLNHQNTHTPYKSTKHPTKSRHGQKNGQRGQKIGAPPADIFGAPIKGSQPYQDSSQIRTTKPRTRTAATMATKASVLLREPGGTSTQATPLQHQATPGQKYKPLTAEPGQPRRWPQRRAFSAREPCG